MSRQATTPQDTQNPVVHHESMGRMERLLEPILFGHRVKVILFFLAISIFLVFQTLKLKPDASFQNMIPASHPYIASYLKYESDLRPLGNVVRIVVEHTQGDIYNQAYLETLRNVTDEVFYIPGVDRGNLKSLWTPNVMWFEVTEEGMAAGHVMPEGFDGSPEKIEQVRTNVVRSGRIGSLVANDHRSAIIMAPLLEIDPKTGEKLDYGQFSERLEKLIRTKFENGNVKIHITGFAKVVGELIHGAKAVALFFGITFALACVLLYAYSRCLRSTAVTILCCSLAVIWQMGIVSLLGFGLNPYSILVPFLTFAIGVSHAVQNINTMAAERYGGHSNMDAAKATFRMLFIPGTVALLCDVVGFSTLLVIDIGVIRELAIGASVGVFVIIFTKMFLLPILMSYVGVSPACLRKQERKSRSQHRFARALSRVTEPRLARAVALVALVILGAAWTASRDLKIGDLDSGAPELRPTSRYNQDNAFTASHYSTSSDVFVVMVKTQPDQCGSYAVAAAAERFQWEMENLPGVESSMSLFTGMKKAIASNSGGDLKWSAITRDRYIANQALRVLPTDLYNRDCSMVPVVLFLSDHKAETLSRVVQAVEKFSKENSTEEVQFILAAGNAGIEAATNMVIKQAEVRMLLLVYGIVALLVWWEFKSWRVTVAVMLPLYITSVLCEAIMARLGLGVKVATLPVIALGVGIGVDYGIYIYNRLEHYLNRGLTLKAAYLETLKTTGAAIAVTGVMLALGVATWVFSDIKFQADMGLLLAFMFLWNMIGAIVMLPALVAILSPPKAVGFLVPASKRKA
jgi:predicted RND superfamily exporter protein